MLTTVEKREALRRKAKKFWESLSRGDRFELGDRLVLGDLDWRDWLHEKPEPGFWNAVEELRVNWEIMDTGAGATGGKKRHAAPRKRGLGKQVAEVKALLK